MIERTEFIYAIVMRMWFKQHCVFDASELFPITFVARYGNCAETVIGNDMTEHISITFVDGNKNIIEAACAFLFTDSEIDMYCRSNQSRDVLHATSWSRTGLSGLRPICPSMPDQLTFLFSFAHVISDRGRLKGRFPPTARLQEGMELRCPNFSWILGVGLTVEANKPLDLSSFILAALWLLAKMLSPLHLFNKRLLH